MRSLVAVLVAIFFVCSTNSLCAQKSDSKVKVKTTSSKPDENGVQKIAIELTIESEWYLYANPVKHESLESAQTTLTIQSASMLRNIKIVYPVGKEKNIEGDTMQVYEGQAMIRATVQRPLNDANPLKLKLRVNACRKACLPTGTIVIDVP